MNTFLPEVAAAALQWNRQTCTKFHTLRIGRSGDPPGCSSRFQVAAAVHSLLEVAGGGIRDTKVALELLFNRPGRVADVALHYQECVPAAAKVWAQTLMGFQQDVGELRTRMLVLSKEARALGLTTREVGCLAGHFVQSAVPPIDDEPPVNNPTTMSKHVALNPKVYRYGECIDGMITDGPISPHALTYAFEAHDGPVGDSPGILRQRLMWRHEGHLGGGDVARDATTKAKLDGGISDYTWEKHVVHGFKHLQGILSWRHPLTETADVANRRRAGMVPYMQCVVWHVNKQKKQYPTGRTILIVALKPMLVEFIQRFLPLGQYLDHLCTHDESGMAIAFRENVCVYVSYLQDATVMGRSNTGDRKGVLHHTRGAIKIIVSGKESRSTLSHTVVSLATGNDHGQETKENVTEKPEGEVEGGPCESLWDQLIEILSSRFLQISGDGRRLSLGETKLFLNFHQIITDGAGAREMTFRTGACSPRDCAHFTPQLKRLRQIVLKVLGMSILRFGSFPGFRGDVVDNLVKSVIAGRHPLVSDFKKLKSRTGICGLNPFHSTWTPMDAWRINPGVWHNGSTWALFFLTSICVMMKRLGCLKEWHRHMTRCVKICGPWKYWLTANGGVEIYGKDADMLRQWLLLVSGHHTFSCDNPDCMKACRSKICLEDGLVHFVGRAQTVELDFVMQINRLRMQIFDETNTSVFWTKVPFLPLLGLVHDGHIADIFGARGLNTKTAEATFLFPAMVDEILDTMMTLASTYEKPMEREHDLAKNEVSRTSVSRGGTGDPNATRARGVKRVAIGAEITKMRRVSGASAAYERLKAAKEEPNYDRQQSSPQVPDTQPCAPSIPTEPDVADGTTACTLPELNPDQQALFGLASPEEQRRILELRVLQAKKYSVAWSKAPCIKVFRVGTEAAPPQDAKLCPNSAMGWDVPTNVKWGGVTTINAKLLYGGNGCVVVVLGQGSHLPTFKYQIDYKSLSALSWAPETKTLVFEFVVPLQLFRLDTTTGNWVRCEHPGCATTGNSCHVTLTFLKKNEAERFEEGLRAMGPPEQTTTLFGMALDTEATMSSEAVVNLRDLCATLNKDATGEFVSPNFIGSDLHRRLEHRRTLFGVTETLHRIASGINHPKRGSTSAFPICCSACRPICRHCGKPHFLVLYPDDTGKCRFVTKAGINHTTCPTLLENPLRTPSYEAVMRQERRCIASTQELFGAMAMASTSPPDSASQPQPMSAPTSQSTPSPTSQPAPTSQPGPTSQPAPAPTSQPAQSIPAPTSQPEPAPAAESTSQPVTLPPGFVRGAKVSARFHNIRGKWYEGIIEKIHNDNTIDILYDDSDREHRVPYHPDRIRLIRILDDGARRSRRNRVKRCRVDFDYYQ